jgi:hypothetical protein
MSANTHASWRSPIPSRRAARASEEFWSEVRALPRRQAQVVALHYLQDRPVAEIAEILVVAFATAAAGILAAPQAGAIVNGEVDGDLHPNVGVLGCRTPEGIMATGTVELISPTVVLTAAHVIDLQAMFGCQPSSFFVSFDAAFDPATSKRFTVTDLVKHPDFRSQPWTKVNDVAVLLLKRPIRDVEPVQLPTAGLLDELKLTGAIQDESFTTVGYGAYLDCSGSSNPFCPLAFDDTRRWASVAYNGHGDDVIKLQMKDGGFCAGDSGGATFLGNAQSNLVVGVTSYASTCFSTGSAQRLDTPVIRSFLSRFVTLP